jgi:hypothetical protein
MTATPSAHRGRDKANRRRPLFVAPVVLILTAAAMGVGDAFQTPLDEYRPLTAMAKGPLQPLDYFLGTWEIDATWAWGTTLQAKNIYELGPGGKSMSVRTVVSDDNAAAYERYQTVFTLDPDAESEKAGETILKAYGFVHDGSVVVMNSTMTSGPDGAVSIRSTWTTDEGAGIDQTVRRVDDNRYNRVVDLTAPGVDSAERVMDADYIRVTD